MSFCITHARTNFGITVDLQGDLYGGHNSAALQVSGRERLSSSNSEDLHISKTTTLAERNKQAQRRHRQRQRASHCPPSKEAKSLSIAARQSDPFSSVSLKTRVCNSLQYHYLPGRNVN